MKKETTQLELVSCEAFPIVRTGRSGRDPFLTQPQTLAARQSNIKSRALSALNRHSGGMHTRLRNILGGHATGSWLAALHRLPTLPYVRGDDYLAR